MASQMGPLKNVKKFFLLFSTAPKITFFFFQICCNFLVIRIQYRRQVIQIMKPNQLKSQIIFILH